MEVIGIICEYNPFHNGHVYHINKVKEMYPDSLIILIVSGYFTQRGEISTLTKEDKTILALDNNVDLVVELPFIYSTQSADNFASYSIKVLNELKINKLIFGSECNDINLLKNIVNEQLNNKNFDTNVKDYLNQGLNYPTALAKALNLKIINPNDLLGISYIKAIETNNLNIEPITIKRSNSFHDIESNDEIISASNIRNKIDNDINIDNYVPKNVINKLTNINSSKLFELLKYKINTDFKLDNYLTVDEGIENRLKKVINEVNSVSELVEAIKTKRYTYNKINRMLIHILIGFLKNDNNLNLEYIRVLGFNKIGQKYLNSLKKEINTPLSLVHDSKIYEYEIKASIIYDLLCNSNTYEYEIKNKPIIKE